MLPDGTGLDEEFYDYGNTLLNTSELGNDISTTAAASAQAAYLAYLGQCSV